QLDSAPIARNLRGFLEPNRSRTSAPWPLPHRVHARRNAARTPARSRGSSTSWASGGRIRPTARSASVAACNQRQSNRHRKQIRKSLIKELKKLVQQQQKLSRRSSRSTQL